MSFENRIESQMSWNEVDLAMNFPLHKACKDGDQRSIPLLLENNALLAKSEDRYLGWTPAHWAAYFGQTDCLISVLTYIVPSFSTVDIQTSNSLLTPAHCAAQAGHAKCLQYLIEAGANPNAQDTIGETPLHKACRNGHSDCVGVCIKACKDSRVSNNVGQTPAAVAVDSGFLGLADWINKCDLTNELTSQFCQSAIHGHRNSLYSFQNAVNAYMSQHLGCRKRRLDSEDNRAKKMRTEEMGSGTYTPSVNGIFNFAITTVPPALSSVVEHENLCKMDTGYSNAFLECMISQFHGC